MKAIQVQNLSKTFEYYKKEIGLKNSFKNLFHREKLSKAAVEDLSFEVEQGEIVGFLGPNGAGKTTTIKLLSGIIYPTNGNINVLGHIPSERKNIFKKEIAVVMAQKTQLWWDLPANERILMNRYIYDVSENDYKCRLKELCGLFHVEDLMSVQVRRLSLGERMKFEIIASLIHNPKVIFLDEPTIGLDLIAQKEMRNFIREYNAKYNATIILTSHYIQDIEELCRRVLIINYGHKVYDGSLYEIKMNPNKIVIFRISSEVLLPMNLKVDGYGPLTKRENGSFAIQVHSEKVKDCLSYLINSYQIIDISVEDEPLENSIIKIYSAKESGAIL